MSKFGGLATVVTVVIAGVLVSCGGEFEGEDSTGGTAGNAGSSSGSGGSNTGGGAVATGGTGGSIVAGSGGELTGGTGGDVTGGTGGDVTGGTGGDVTGGTGGEITGGSGGTAGELTGGSGGDLTGGTGGELTGGTGGAVQWGACQLSPDCVIRAASCCGQCGAATRDDIIALNQNELSDYNSSACAGGMGCPGCYMPTDANLVATCQGGQCSVVDLLESPITACAANTDCRVRTNDCCECGGGTTQEDLIAINIAHETHYSLLVCDPNAGCFECAPQYPPEAMAVCDAGRCLLVWGATTGP